MGIIAICVKIESPGPAIYAQRRCGKDGKIFKIYKFRSMYSDAEARGARWAAGDDPRITSLGRKLRKTRLDEIFSILERSKRGGGMETQFLAKPVFDVSPVHLRTLFQKSKWAG